MQFKYVAYKHIAAGLHNGSAYTMASALVHVPLALVESFVFGVVLYYMTGFYNAAPQFLWFITILFLTNVAMRSFFVIFAYGMKDMQVRALYEI